MVSHEMKVIFIHVHRTGGTTLGNLLRQNLTESLYPYGQHVNAKNLEDNFWDNHKEYYIFGFTRNPWARILSWYALIHRHSPLSLTDERIRFQRFIEQGFASVHFHYNTLDYYTQRNGTLAAHTVYRYENMESEIQALYQRLGWSHMGMQIPRLNGTGLRDYREYYTSKSRALIA